MKFNDILKLSFVKSYRNKKHIFLILIFIISVLVLLCTITFKIVFFDNVDKIEESIDYRTLIVSANSDDVIKYENDFEAYGYNEILNINHVVAMFDTRYDHIEVYVPQYQTNNYNGMIQLQSGADSIMPEVVLGRDFDEEETGVAICPINFYPSIENISDDKVEFINGEDLLNTVFEIESTIFEYDDGFKDSGEKYHKKLKIIGLYNSEKSRNLPYECYVNNKDIKEIYNSLDVEQPGTITAYGVYVYVDRTDNVNEVLKEIRDLGFNAKLSAYFDEEYHSSIKLICSLMVIITTLAIAILTFLYVRKQIYNNSSSIGILKAIGYKNNLLCLISALEIFILSISSVIIGITIFEFLLLFIKTKFKTFLMYNLVEIQHFIYPYVLTLLIIIFIPIIITIIVSLFKNKSNTVNLIKEK